MKNRYLIYSLLISILCITLMILAAFNVINYKNYDIYKSIVFISSSNGDDVKNGMGFVYKKENYINYVVTNYHVVEGYNQLYISNLDNKKVKAKILFYDVYSDIAVLQVEDNINLSVSKIGINNIKPSDYVYYYNIMSKKIESALVLDTFNQINLNANYGNSFYNAISIKANIETGNSGGPIFNKNNEVIGIVCLKDKKNNIGFLVPIDYVMEIVTKLENHTLIRPELGGKFINTTDADKLSENNIYTYNLNGVVIVDVIENYPLSDANLKKGDIIVNVNGVVINNVNDLQREIYSYNIGDEIEIEYYRNNQHNKVNVELDK